MLETDELVTRDIRWSLKPLDLEVKAFGSVTEVLQALSVSTPECILTRILVHGVHGDEIVGFVLVEKLLAANLQIPVIAACSNSELAYVKGKEAIFEAVLSLPVEFPRFTEVVKGLLENSFSGSNPELPPVRTASIPVASDDTRRIFEEQAGNPTLERNVLLVYQIHHLVLKELESQGEFHGLLPHQVPRILLDVTRKVCGKVSIDGV